MPEATPRVRVRPAPPYDPPYDDERSADGWTELTLWQPMLDLRWPPRPVDPARSAGQGTERPAGRAADRTAGRADRAAGRAAHPRPPGVTETADVPPAVGRFLGVCLEIFNGYRAIAQVRSLACPIQAGQVVTAVAHAARHLREALAVPAVPSRPRVRLLRHRLGRPAPGVYEVAAVIGPGAAQPGGPAWAFAFRVERRADGWRCTTAELLVPASSGHVPDPPPTRRQPPRRQPARRQQPPGRQPPGQ